jgi:hypothetical protein
LLFCGVILAYFVSILVAGLLLRATLPHLRNLSGGPAGLVVGLMLLDLGKLPGLVLAAFVLGRLTELGPRLAALVLTLGVYALDMAAAAVFFVETQGASIGGRSATSLEHQSPAGYFAWEGLLVRAALAWLFGWAALGLLRQGQAAMARARRR